MKALLTLWPFILLTFAHKFLRAKRENVYDA